MLASSPAPLPEAFTFSPHTPLFGSLPSGARLCDDVPEERGKYADRHGGSQKGGRRSSESPRELSQRSVPLPRQAQALEACGKQFQCGRSTPGRCPSTFSESAPTNRQTGGAKTFPGIEVARLFDPRGLCQQLIPGLPLRHAFLREFIPPRVLRRVPQPTPWWYVPNTRPHRRLGLYRHSHQSFLDVPPTTIRRSTTKH